MTRVLRGDRCRCTACGEYFRSTYAFDRHRQGPYTDRRCLAVAAMSEAGFKQDSRGYWMSPRRGTMAHRRVMGLVDRAGNEVPHDPLG